MNFNRYKTLSEETKNKKRLRSEYISNISKKYSKNMSEEQKKEYRKNHFNNALKKNKRKQQFGKC